MGQQRVTDSGTTDSRKTVQFKKLYFHICIIVHIYIYVSGKYTKLFKRNDWPSMPDKDSNVVSATDHMLL